MFQRNFITRTTPATRMTPEGARKLLEQAVASARAVEGHIVLLRPATMCAVMSVDPRLLVWRRCGDDVFRPVYTSGDGRPWTVEPSEQLYPHRQEKRLSGLCRGMISSGGAK